MQFGLFTKSNKELRAAHKRAMRIGAFAAAERIAFQLNEPGKLYIYSCRAKQAVTMDMLVEAMDNVEPNPYGKTVIFMPPGAAIPSA